MDSTDKAKISSIESKFSYDNELYLTEFPYDFECNDSNKTERAIYNSTLKQDINNELLRISKGSLISLYLLLLSNINITLYKYNNKSKFIIGSPLYTLKQKDNLQCIVPIVSEFTDLLTFKEYLIQMKETTMRSYIDYELILEQLDSNIVTNIDNQADKCQITVSLQNLQVTTINNSTLNIKFLLEDNNIHVEVMYDKMLISMETIKLFIDRFMHVTQQVIDNPTILINDIELMSRDEEEYILNALVKGKVDVSNKNDIIQALSIWNEKKPHELAIQYENESITYQELDKKSNKAARLLKEFGIDSNITVAIMCERSIDMIVSIIAVFKAGGAYVPIDSNYPIDRIADMLVSSCCKVLITNTNSIKTTENIFNIIKDNTYLNNIVFLDSYKDIDSLQRTFRTIKFTEYISDYKNPQVNYEENFEYDNVIMSPKEVFANAIGIVDFCLKEEIKMSRVGILSSNKLDTIIIINALRKLNYEYYIINTELICNSMVEFINDNLIDCLIIDDKKLHKIKNNFWSTNILENYIVYNSSEKETIDVIDDIEKLWDYVAEETLNEVNSYGWNNSYDGSPFTIEEMQQYISNFKTKLSSFLDKDKRVLDVGCGSGLVLNELASEVSYYYATDLSKVIIEKNKVKYANKNIEFEALAANNIGKLKGMNFDIVVCSSVIHYFESTFYLEEMIKGAIESLAEQGIIYLDDLMNLRKKKDLELSTYEYSRKNPNKRTKVDWDTDLFIDPSFFDMLASRYKEITHWEMSNKLGDIENELTKYRYDVVIYVDKAKKDSISNSFATKKQYKLTSSNRQNLSREDFDKKDLNSNLSTWNNDISSFEYDKFNVIDRNRLFNYSDVPLVQNNSGEDMAYIIFTSGSTGKPKGAIVKRKGMLNHLYAKINDFELNEDTRIVQNASHCFDISVWQMMAGLIVGGKVYVYSDQTIKDTNKFLHRVIEDNITVLQLVPSYLSALLDVLEIIKCDLESLKYLSVTGEAIKKNIIKRWFDLYKNVKVVNAYGPTEASDDITHYIFDKLSTTKTIPVGKPLSNLNIYILGKDDKIVPIGFIGEICVSGIGVGGGYINNQSKTDEVFVEHPYVKEGKLYRTGDLGRYMYDGNIVFIERIDNQVKIRGFRIETTEIEIALESYPSIEKAVVISKEDENSEKYLCSYIVADQTTSISDVMKYLETRLPIYMIPSQFITLDKIPLTDNGKVDKKTLLMIENKEELLSMYVEPKNEIQKKLVVVWTEVLPTKRRIGIMDNYFQLGGDSIKAIQISARMQKYGFKVDIGDIFTYTTIEELSLYIKEINTKVEQGDVVGEAPLTPIQKYFFENNPSNSTTIYNHYNQSVILYNKTGFDYDIMLKVFKKLIGHHDTLRVYFKLIDNSYYQIFNSTDSINDFDIHVFHLKDKEKYQESIQQQVNQMQKDFSISDNLLINCAIFKTNEGDYLSIIAHHLVIDGISWRILLEDMTNLYNQIMNEQEVKLPLKTQSYLDWTKVLYEYSTSDTLLEERKFWNKISNTPVGSIKTDFDIDTNYTMDSKIETTYLGVEETNTLLMNVPNAYNTHIDDILIAALYITMSEWNKNNKILINLESHGRESIGENINIDRTIGWFTSLYPVLIDMPTSSSISEVIINTKEILHHIPNKGIGYGIIKYLMPENLHGEMKIDVKPEISFNYLGQFDNNFNTDLFELSELNKGDEVNPYLQREAILEFSCMIVNGKLEINICYNHNHFKLDTVKHLLNRYKENLYELIQHCSLKEENELTASDFSDSELDMEEVNAFFEELSNLDIE